MSEIVGAVEGMLRSHAAAYGAIKRRALARGLKPRVGIAHSVQVFDPKDWWNPLHHWAAGEMHKASNWTFMDAMESGKLSLHIPYMVDAEKEVPGLKGTQDFIGLNYYTRYRISVNPMSEQKIIQSVTPGAPVNDMGWEIFPEGMYRIVTDTAKRFAGKPILITENGLADAADSRRRAFLEDHLAQLARAMADGAPVEAYCHWSLVDNFEWAHGFGPRFGLYEVDYSSFKRVPRPSAFRYAEIIRANGLSR
jgi:beta-glucosidase